jgi:hypothetical protein
MSFSTVTVAPNGTLNTTNNTSPVSLTYTLTTTDYQDISQFCQQVAMRGGIFTDSKHWFPVGSIQYLDIS